VKQKIFRKEKIDEWMKFKRFYSHQSPKSLEKHIQKYLIPIEKLNDEYQSIYNSDDLNKRKFLQSNFLTTTDDSIEFTSLLYHIYYFNTLLNENLQYIRYIVPNCNNELGLLFVYKLNWELEERIWNNHLIYSFDSPHFGEFVLSVLLDWDVDKLEFDFDKEDMFLIQHFLEYLRFCVEQKTMEDSKVKKTVKNLLNNFDVNGRGYLRKRYRMGNDNFSSYGGGIPISVHLRDLTVSRKSDNEVEDGYKLHLGYYKDEIPFGELSYKEQEEIRKHNQQEWRKLEQEIREELGLPKIGEQWISETSVYYIVKKILNELNVEVKHHHHPFYLDGKELDIYFEYGDIKVGIEYQGLQHFKPIDFFGGEESFKELQKRDKEKKKQCEENGVHLIYINHDEPITEKLVIQKIKSVIDI
jgi:hypothetical protein